MKEKVANLIKNAKRRFYETQTSELRVCNPRKWFKSIYAFCGAGKQSTSPTAPTPDELNKVADNLLQVLTTPWENRVNGIC